MPKPTGSGYSFKNNSSSRTENVATKSTPPRNSPLPKPQAGKRPVTQEAIAKRAYEIYASGKGGNAIENWLRAENELKNS
jgi:hypothetical protein